MPDALLLNQGGYLLQQNGGEILLNQNPLAIEVTFSVFNTIPSLLIPSTDAQIKDQGYTYNQVGLAYNQAGVAYGGVYQLNQDLSPVFFNNFAFNAPLELNIPSTDAQLISQGYTYNQAGLTYNQAGVQYGGVSQGNQDIIPIYFNDKVINVTPEIVSVTTQ